ncbi:hypothetical protein PENSPDRAFT_264183 [Peniophora sp. CONT]|nr:hypothetical protein PENSPDRAFT_264183 [Peniophora sp. CONT]
METAKELQLGVSAAKAHLLATFLVTLFLGFNVVLCFVCVQILINRRRRGVANSGRLIFATFLQICICIGHASTYLWASFQAYVYHAADAYGAAKYLNAHWAVGWKATQLGFFASNDLCYNTILVWRCHVVMNADWRCTLPLAILVCTSSVGGFGIAATAATLPADSGPIHFFRAIVPYLTVFNLTSCVLQVVASSVIGWKVWTVLVHDADSKPRSCSLIGAEYASLRIIIESGVMRTVCGILLLPLVWKHNMAGVVVSAVSAQVDATASYLIIIRTESLRDHRPRTTNILSDVYLESIQLTDLAKSRELRQRRATMGSVKGSLI